MTPTTMVAAVYQPGNNKLVLDRHYPIRALKDDEILLKVSAAGVCHSDVLILNGSNVDTRKYVVGHEGCGLPVKLGADVDSHKIQLGKLYSILLITSCVHGMNGAPALFSGLGAGADGVYAEYVITTADALVPVPDGVRPEVAAIASDAGITAYHAVQHTAKARSVKHGEKVLIFGIGGLGHLAVQYAKHFGATVYACDFKPVARELALELGATEVFDLIELTNKTAAGFTVDTTIDFVANNQTFALALAALRGNSVNFPVSTKLVLVGASAETLGFATLDIITTGISIISSQYGPRSALIAVLDLFAKGIVRAHVHSEPLENINKVLDELRAVQITGRKVVIPRHRD
ncbi:chaperonin 10-like protein [Mycena rebaudengoi]|nr:chaperonin 10-like protein [Mycena rebaudengoi]